MFGDVVASYNLGVLLTPSGQTPEMLLSNLAVDRRPPPGHSKRDESKEPCPRVRVFNRFFFFFFYII